MAELDRLLRHLEDQGGSDLHLAAGMEPRVRVRGEPVPGWGVLEDAALRELLKPIAAERHWREWLETHDLDFAYGLAGVARFRANYFEQEHGAGAVFRMIPEQAVSLDTLALPPAIAKLAELRHGLLLVTGPTGSGKSPRWLP